MGQPFDRLPSVKRATHYRAMAAAALQRATNATDETSGAEFLALAAAWQVLAVELEHLTGLVQQLNATGYRYGEKRPASARKRVKQPRA